MTTATQPRLGNGTFTYDPKPEGVVADLSAQAPIADYFADWTPAEQEAAAAYADAFPGVRPEVIERHLFETYTDEEYDAEVNDPNSSVSANRHNLFEFKLPSGGYGLFFDKA